MRGDNEEDSVYNSQVCREEGGTECNKRELPCRGVMRTEM